MLKMELFVLYDGIVKHLLISFLVCLVMMPIAMYLARKVGLLDKPNTRKNHIGSTPLVGGICIFASLCIVSVLTGKVWGGSTLLFWLFVVLCVGVLDDFLDVSVALRVAVHLVVVVGIWLTNGLVVSSIGSILSPESTVIFSVIFGLMFTVVAVIGAINTVNMIDGIDGLLGSLVIISLCALLLWKTAVTNQSLADNSIFDSQDLLVLLGSVAAFLVFNLRLIKGHCAKVFLGDAGSTFLGFVLVYIVIDYSQGQHAIFSPVVAGWLIGLPLLDASAVIVTRIIKRQSPVTPANDHMHHLLHERGFDVNRVVLIMASIHAVMIVIAYSVSVVTPAYSDLLLFWGFLLLVVFRVVLGYRASESPVTHYSRSFEEYAIPDTKRGAALSTGRAVKASSSGKATA